MDNYFVKLLVVLLGGEFGLHYYASGRIGKDYFIPAHLVYWE